ncbi:MAG: hypothetical protein KKC18_08355 [Chloroflexi bacterium]|nr:hypothetical protein [Chloroflexota bacterium]
MGKLIQSKIFRGNIQQFRAAMQRAIETGEPYQTLLDPPPADPRMAHPPH